MTTSKIPTYENLEWRVNTSLSNPRRMFWDLFIDGAYQHAWIKLEQDDGKYHLHTWDTNLGAYDTFSQAEEYILAVAVVKRFNEARW